MALAGIRRPSEGRVLGGVCAAIGVEADLDPVAVRIVAVVLAALGAGVPLYLIAWAALPTDERERRRLHPDRPIPALIVLLIVAVAGSLMAEATVAVLAEATGFGPTRDIEPALFLILLGLGALWWREAARLPEPALPSPSPAMGDPAAAARPAPPPTPRTVGDVLFAPTVVLIALIVGAAPTLLPDRWLGDVGPDQALAAAVLVLGLGLIAGAFLHRGAWIIPFGALAAVMLAVVAIAGVDFRGGTGERILAPLSAGGVPEEFQLAAGTADIDLRGLRLGGRSVTLDARIAAGRMTVRLPPESAVVLRARSGFGQIIVEPGERTPTRLDLVGDTEPTGASGREVVSGINVETDLELPGDEGLIEIEADVGFGEIKVSW